MYFMPASLASLHPGIGVEIRRVEFFRVILIFGHRNFSLVHDPFADAADLFAVVGSGGNGINAPMNEHSEPGLAPPFHPGIALRGRFVGVRIGAGNRRGFFFGAN